MADPLFSDGRSQLPQAAGDWVFVAGCSGLLPLLDEAPGNQAPTADAGPDNGAAVSSLPAVITLQGSGTDDGLPDPPAALTYLWELISGPGTATFDDATDPTTAVELSTYGVYVLRLTVSDGDLSDSDEVTITITQALPPLTWLLAPVDTVCRPAEVVASGVWPGRGFGVH